MSAAETGRTSSASTTGATTTPCADPEDEGGALRSQSLRRNAGEPVRPQRPDPAGRPGHRRGDARQPARRRARTRTRAASSPTGLRNPFRFTIRPGTERALDRRRRLERLGGDRPDRHPRATRRRELRLALLRGHRSVSRATRAPTSTICENLYSTPGAVTRPVLHVQPQRLRRARRDCPTGGSSSITGSRSTTAAPTRRPYNGALFFADYSRKCIWVMLPRRERAARPGEHRDVRRAARPPVDLEIGPDGNLFYVDLDGGTIDRIRYFANDLIPTADATATPTSGGDPLTVQFDGTGSSDPDRGDVLTLRLGLTATGRSTTPAREPSPMSTQTPGIYTARLTVTDQQGATNTSDPIDDLRGRHAAGAEDPDPVGVDDVEGGRHDQLLGPGRRRAGRAAARLGPDLDADPPPLPVELPHAPRPELPRHRERVVLRSGPRLPVISRAPAQGDGLGRATPRRRRSICNRRRRRSRSTPRREG